MCSSLMWQAQSSSCSTNSPAKALSRGSGPARVGGAPSGAAARWYEPPSVGSQQFLCLLGQAVLPSHPVGQRQGGGSRGEGARSNKGVERLGKGAVCPAHT